MRLRPYLRRYTKTRPKWIEDLTVIPETGKRLEKNFLTLGWARFFFTMTPKVQATQAKIDKGDCIKLKPSTQQGKPSDRVKGQPAEWEEIFSNHVSDKRLISKII